MENPAKPKRKTHTSTAVKQRYNAKTYERVSVLLRKIDDADVIAAIAARKASGMQTSDAVKSLIREALNK